MIIIAVSGWRGFVGHDDRAWIETQMVFWADVLSLGRKEIYWRVADEDKGADSVALQFVSDAGVPYCLYEADWSLPHKAGGPVRSLHMLQGKSPKDLHQGVKADYLLAFPQPGKRFPRHEEVSGTYTCMEQAKRYGITTITPGYTKPEPERLF